MIALVFGVIAASIFAGSMHLVFGSQSTKTAVAPAIQIASAVAKKVLDVVMTSSPGPMPRAIKASQIASVPLPSADGVFRAVISRQFALELLEHRPHDILAALEDVLDVVIDFRFDVVVLANVAVKFNFHGSKRYRRAGVKQVIS